MKPLLFKPLIAAMAALLGAVLPSRAGAVRAWALGLALCACADVRADVLRVLAWPGYADADLVAAFAQRSGHQVQVTLVDSDEALWQRVRQNQGRDFDVFAVNTAELQRHFQAGHLAALDRALIPNTGAQLPRFRRVETIHGLTQQGRLYGVPYTYAEMGLIYDRQQLPEPPRSVQSLWDERWRGKVLLYNGASHNFSLAALALGQVNPFQIAPTHWAAAADKLIALRRNALRFYTDPQDSADLFKSRRAALMLANYGSQQVQLLKQAGVDVGYVVPAEGALAWLDVWAMTREARNPALVHQWINYCLEREPSEALTLRQGLAHTLAEPAHLHSSDRLIWLEPVEDTDRRQTLWERIYSGDRLPRVLAP